MKISIRYIIIFTLLLLVGSTQRADAYLDPSTGSYLLQIMTATIFGGLFVVKTWWKEIKRIVMNVIFRKDVKTSENDLPKKK